MSSGLAASASSRSRLSGVWNSLMSSRTSRAEEPNRNSASAFASSVFRSRWGRRRGRRRAAGPDRSARLDSAIRSTRQSTASGCPSTPTAKLSRTASRSIGLRGSSSSSGIPVAAASARSRCRRHRARPRPRARWPLMSSRRSTLPGAASPADSASAKSAASSKVSPRRSQPVRRPPTPRPVASASSAGIAGRRITSNSSTTFGRRWTSCS